MNLEELEDIKIGGGYLPIVDSVQFTFRLSSDEITARQNEYNGKTQTKYQFLIILDKINITDQAFFDAFKKLNNKKAKAIEDLKIGSAYTLELSPTYSKQLAKFIKEQNIDINKHMISMIRINNQDDNGNSNYTYDFAKIA